MHREEVGEIRSKERGVGEREREEMEDEKLRGRVESRVENREDKGRGDPKAKFSRILGLYSRGGVPRSTMSSLVPCKFLFFSDFDLREGRDENSGISFFLFLFFSGRFLALTKF